MDTNRETKREDGVLGNLAFFLVGGDEGLQALPAEVKKLLPVLLLLFLRETIFGLGDLELPRAFERHETDAEVGSAYNAYA